MTAGLEHFWNNSNQYPSKENVAKLCKLIVEDPILNASASSGKIGLAPTLPKISTHSPSRQPAGITSQPVTLAVTTADSPTFEGSQAQDDGTQLFAGSNVLSSASVAFQQATLTQSTLQMPGGASPIRPSRIALTPPEAAAFSYYVNERKNVFAVGCTPLEWRPLVSKVAATLSEANVKVAHLQVTHQAVDLLMPEGVKIAVFTTDNWPTSTEELNRLVVNKLCSLELIGAADQLILEGIHLIEAAQLSQVDLIIRLVTWQFAVS